MTAPSPAVEDFALEDPGFRVALKQRIVAAYLQNPFRDDDAQIIAARLGESRREVAAALQDLCTDQLLKPAAERGYMLDALRLARSSGGEMPAPETKVSADAEVQDTVGLPAPVTDTSKQVEAESSSAAEVSAAFAHFQEELFNQLRSEVVEPLWVIQDFLENQEPTQLGLARAALQQIHWAVQELGLSGESPVRPGGDAAEDSVDEDFGPGAEK